MLSDTSVARLRHVVSWPETVDGRYTVVGEIGRGGMGVVYRALDNVLGREVALKVPNVIDRASLDSRLRKEAQVLARLEHPGIVPVHDAGRLADGRMFYVMKWVRGCTLREHLQHVADVSERLRIFERICEPVAFAHAAGVIHRDLKPENVMVGTFGEVIVMDWGIAKQLADAGDPDAGPVSGTSVSDVTDHGAIVGTRGFMPPEQAQGEADGVDRRADVFSLGVILFLLLTGDLPRDGEEAATSIAGRHDLPKPLRAICARALEGSAEDRYQDVTALAADVARYRDGRRVEAYDETMLERAVRVARRYRVAILLILAYILMRVAVAVLAGW